MEFIVALFLAIAGALAGNGFALWRVKKERLWEEKRTAYREIVTALHMIKQVCKQVKFLSIERDRLKNRPTKHTDNGKDVLELFDNLNECKVLLHKAVDLGDIVISKTSSDTVERFLSKQEQILLEMGAEIILDKRKQENNSTVIIKTVDVHTSNYWNKQEKLVQECLVNIRRSARKDLYGFEVFAFLKL